MDTKLRLQEIKEQMRQLSLERDSLLRDLRNASPLQYNVVVKGSRGLYRDYQGTIKGIRVYTDGTLKALVRWEFDNTGKPIASPYYARSWIKSENLNVL